MRFSSALPAAISITITSTFFLLTGCATKSKNSAEFANHENVDSEPKIIQQPRDVTAKVGDTITLEVKGSGTKHYMWEESPDGKTWDRSIDWTLYLGIPENTHLVEVNKLTTTFYRCVLINGEKRLVSRALTLSIVPGFPVIIQEPQDVTAAEGDLVSFSVKASPGCTYEWNGIGSNAIPLPDLRANPSFRGSDSNQLQFRATRALNDKYFHCTITNRNGKISTAGALLTVIVTPTKN